MLIRTARMRPGDEEAWSVLEEIDALNARRLARRLEQKAARAMGVIAEFAARGPCYMGVSWGKDSVVIAHLAHQAGVAVPSVWVRIGRRDNPDCPLVRDQFLSRFPLDYTEIKAPPHEIHGPDHGFREAARCFGDRHISGVRAEESATRARTVARNGEASTGSCRPIARWSTEEVFTYIHLHRLPLHPAYGYGLGGRLARDQLRVASIGGHRGTGHGRAEWERTYYPEVRPWAR